MRLNADCIRDILIALESCEYNNTLSVDLLSETLPQYAADELQYNSLKLYEAKLIDAVCYTDQEYAVQRVHELIDITYAGHQFLAKIRDDKRWGSVKRGLSAVRDYSLSAITSIAEGVTSAAINAYFSGQICL